MYGLPLHLLSDDTIPCKMSRGALFNFLVCSLSLAVTTIGMPMTAPFSIRNGSMISAYDKIDVGSHPLEIRGVYGGRKRRYIIEKAKPGSCPHKCKEKPICLPTFGEIIKDCRCQKCLTGVPDPRGNFCQETCPEGMVMSHTNFCETPITLVIRPRKKRKRWMLPHWPETKGTRRWV